MSNQNTTITALIIPTEDRAFLQQVPAEGQRDTDGNDMLDHFQKQVGGYIEAIDFGPDFMYVNEHANRLGMPENPTATRMLMAYRNDVNMESETLRGNVVVLSINPNDEGAEASVRPEALKVFTGFAGYTPEEV